MTFQIGKQSEYHQACSIPPWEGRWGGAKCYSPTQEMSDPGSIPGGVRFWDVYFADVR